MIEIIPTVVPLSFADIAREAGRFESLASALHIDICDGAFASPRTWQPAERDALPEGRYEAHVMARDPLAVGLMMIRTGATRIYVHLEAIQHVDGDALIDSLKQSGAEVGLAILFQTPIEELAPWREKISAIHCMTIASIGRQGIPFEPGSVERVALIRDRFTDVEISVDGGVSLDNIAALSKAGATRFCVGSTLQESPSPRETFAALKAAAESAIY